MATENKIPIKNIYHMLSYSWGSLNERELVNVGKEDFQNIYNLLAKIYINGVTGLLKRGLNRDYIGQNDDLSGIKGQLNVTKSVSNLNIFFGKANCDFDELSEDMIFNKILKETIYLFLKVPQLKKSYKHKLIKLKPYFHQFRKVELTTQIYSRLRYDRNNSHYKILMNISELLHLNTLPNEDTGEYLFRDYLRDDRLSGLFEKFILNFYKQHLSRGRYIVHSPKIQWKLDEFNTENNPYLPLMETDIVIEDKLNKEQLIIDTKFYQKTLSEGQYDNIKVQSPHLYQIFSYIENSNYRGTVGGMLLYPKVDIKLDQRYFIKGKSIEVQTLDLSDQWVNIENTLLNII